MGFVVEEWGVKMMRRGGIGGSYMRGEEKTIENENVNREKKRYMRMDYLSFLI